MRIRLGFGEGASPALFGDRIIVNWDHQGQSFITALDKQTGREIWKVDRDEETSWTTPLVVEHDGRVQVVTSATSRVRSYDFQSGRLLWEGEGVTQNAIPTPVADDQMVYMTSGYLGSRLMAVRLSAATGDIDRSGAIAWEVDRDTPYVPSPLLHRGVLYVLKGNSGVLSAYEARTGRKLYGPQRVAGAQNVYASPVAAGERVYVTSREGTTVVLRAGPGFEVLATNTLQDDIDASAAIVDGEIYLRGSRYLYCIAAD
jgi:outer membrane protein assembly factor BamB